MKKLNRKFWIIFIVLFIILLLFSIFFARQKIKPHYFCGDNICESEKGENEINCPQDCKAFCGNNQCEKNENYQNCPTDCCAREGEIIMPPNGERCCPGLVPIPNFMLPPLYRINYPKNLYSLWRWHLWCRRKLL